MVASVGKQPGLFEEIAREAAAGLGLEIVAVRVHDQGAHSIVRIDIDRAGPKGVDLHDCEAMSRAFDAILESRGIARDRHELQVSSPGVDRPIRTTDDVRRNSGRRVLVEIEAPGDVPGVRLLRGVLLGGDGSAIRIAVDDGGEVSIPMDRVSLARQDVGPPPRGRRRKR